MKEDAKVSHYIINKIQQGKIILIHEGGGGNTFFRVRSFIHPQLYQTKSHHPFIRLKSMVKMSGQ